MVVGKVVPCELVLTLYLLVRSRKAANRLFWFNNYLGDGFDDLRIEQDPCPCLVRLPNPFEVLLDSNRIESIYDSQFNSVRQPEAAVG